MLTLCESHLMSFEKGKAKSHFNKWGECSFVLRVLYSVFYTMVYNEFVICCEDELGVVSLRKVLPL